MIKTLHLTNAYHEHSGGIRTFYRALLESAGHHRRHVRLVVPAERSWVEHVNDFARVYHLPAPQSAFIDRRYRLILPHRFALGRQSALWRILREEEPDLIEVCDKYSLCHLGSLIRRRWFPGRQRPAVVGLTCERMDDNVATFLSGSAAARRFARWYMRSAYSPQFDGHIAVSSYTGAELEGGLRPIYVRPMGIDTGRFAAVDRQDARRRRLLGDAAAPGAPGAIVLLYAGRLSTEKNLPLLLDTLDLLQSDNPRPTHLVIAGAGPLSDWVSREGARRAPGRVHLIGHVAGREQLAELYADADIFLHPNPREPFGLAPLEAMAAGLPVVVPVTGGVREYATERNAWLAEATGPAFAHAVRTLLCHPDERDRRRDRARQTAADHDWRIVTARYFQVYDELHERSASTRPTTPAPLIDRSTARAGRLWAAFRDGRLSQLSGR